MATSLCIQFRNIKTIKNVSKQLFYGLKLCMMEWCGWSSSRERERNVRFHFPSPTHHSPTKCLGLFFPSLSCWKALEIRKFHPFILLHLFISLLSFSQEVNSFHSPNCSPLFEIEWRKRRRVRDGWVKNVNEREMRATKSSHRQKKKKHFTKNFRGHIYDRENEEKWKRIVCVMKTGH